VRERESAKVKMDLVLTGILFSFAQLVNILERYLSAQFDYPPLRIRLLILKIETLLMRSTWLY